MKFQMRVPGIRTAIVMLLLIWLVLCKPWFLDGKSVPWDSKDQFFPTLHFVAQALRHGEIPAWNPYVYSGYPIISDPYAMIFSPVAVLLMTVVPQPSIHWFDGIELLHVLLAGIGMLLLTVRLHRSTPAALFAAMIYMYGGSASGRMQHVPMIYAYSYFPFALMALDHALESRRLRSAACFGILAGIMAAHQNQVAYLFCLTLLGYLVFQAVSAGSTKEFLLERWRVLAVSGLVGAATLAVPLYLTLQFLPLSNRLHIPFQIAVDDSMRPLTLLTLFVRNFFGNARPNSYWGLGDVSETYLFAGTLPIVLIARYGIGRGILLERQFRYFFYVGVVSVLYALGRFTPFYWIVYHILPGVDLYRRPTDATFVMNMVFAMAAGFLMDRLLSGEAGHIRSSIVWLMGIPVAGLFAWGFLYAFEQHKLPSMTKDLLLTALFVGISLWLLRAIVSASSHQLRLGLVFVALLLLTVDMGVHNAGSRLNAVPEQEPLLMEDAAQKNPVAHFMIDGLNSDKDHGAYRADITGAGAGWDNAPMLLDIQSTQGYNPLRYVLYGHVVGAAENFTKARPFSPLLPTYNATMLNLLGVKYIVSRRSLSEIDPQVRPENFPLVFDLEGIQIWQNPAVFPRILAATSFYVEPDLEHAIDEGKMAMLDYRSVVVVSHLPETLQDLKGSIEAIVPLPGSGRSEVKMVEYRNNQVTVAVESSRDVILVLNDPYYPYWRAYVDGQRRELLQANYLFRGVHIRPGEHEVVFRFEPFSWSAVKGTFERLLRSI